MPQQAERYLRPPNDLALVAQKREALFKILLTEISQKLPAPLPR